MQTVTTHLLSGCRLGQTRQVTVYRLICKGTIEERILQRAREKSEIHRIVIQGGSFKGRSQADLKPKEVVSLLLDDEEIEKRVKVKVEEEEEKVSREKTEMRKTKKREVVDKENGQDGGKKKLKVDSDTRHQQQQQQGPPRPLLDFAGDKMGPRKVKGRGGGKRGRPRGGVGRGQLGRVQETSPGPSSPLAL